MHVPQMHHLLNNGAEVNQRDEKGFTPLHRAAYLAHYNGYLELYEYLLVRSLIVSDLERSDDTSSRTTGAAPLADRPDMPL